MKRSEESHNPVGVFDQSISFILNPIVGNNDG